MFSQSVITRFVDEVIALFPEFQKVPEDAQISQGSGALVVIDSDGNVFGHIFGNDKRRGKGIFDVANKKATQVWLTGHATGDFERKIFAGELDEGAFPIMKPDYVGWDGGLPLTIGGVKVSAAFSGFRGFNDQAILRKAAEKIG